MRKLVLKFISLIIILNLLIPRGMFYIAQVSAQTVESPTSVPKSPSEASPPKPESSESPASVPQPTKSEEANTANNNISPTSQLSPAGSSEGSTQTTESPTPTDSVGPETNQSGSDSLSSTNQAPPELGKEGGVNDPANTGTGPFSDNFAQEINNKVQNIVNNNLVQMENKLAALSSTGFNFANLNTLDGQVVTGNALATMNLLNKLNSNMTGVGGFSVYNIYDTFKGNIIFQLPSLANGFISATPTVSKNSVTGPNSNNVADAQNSFTVNEANDNDATLVNDLVLEAVSGGNSASFNTGGGSIQTGNATALANVINMVNTNLNVSEWLIGVVNVFGTLAGNIVLPQDVSGSPVENNSTVLAENSNTGFGSTNNVTVDKEKTEDTTNINIADIETTLNVSANTGDNTANINTGGGSISTGQSDVSVSNTTVANSNTVKEEETVWMVIVNEMGKWVGYIMGAPWESNIASNSLPLTNQTSGVPEQSYSVLAQNSGTGPLSNNEASYTETDDTTITNNNTAGIVNNINASSDTGSNNASYNTGAGVIDTGNAKTGINLVNMVNTNVVAKKFVTILVNVLGEFLGNIIPPDQNQNTQLADNKSNSDNHNSSGGTGSPLIPTPTPTTVYNNPNNSSFIVASSDVVDVPYSPDVYNQAVENYNTSVQYTQNKVPNKKKLAAPMQYPVTIGQTTQNAGFPKRGIFVSQAFAKATESTLPGILLGGISLKVSPSWLSVVPIALFLVVLRRRKKINIEKYLNYLLEIIL